jgi:hypothetical protein
MLLQIRTCTETCLAAIIERLSYPSVVSYHSLIHDYHIKKAFQIASFSQTAVFIVRDCALLPRAAELPRTVRAVVLSIANREARSEREGSIHGLTPKLGCRY